MMLAQFASNDDGGQEAESHAEGDALPDCLNTGKLRYVGGANVGQSENAVEFFPVSASRFSEQQILSRQIGRLYRALGGKRVAGIGQQEDLLRTQADGLDVL